MNLNDIRTKKRLADIEAALTARPHTQIQLAVATFMNEVSTGGYVRYLMAEGLIYIEGWDENVRGHKIARYVWGAGRNAYKPKPRSKVMIERDRMKRIKADPDAYDRFLSMHRARYAARKAVKTPATWLSALGVR